jgi:immune inhibitor A
LLILTLAASLVAADSIHVSAMPPHPDLVKQIKEGIKPKPYFLANHGSLMDKGVNQSSAIRGKSRPSVRAEGPSGSFNALALLVDFSDNAYAVSAGYFDTLVFGAGSGSVRDFYSEVSYTNLTIVTVTLPSAIGWLRAPQTYAYYVNGQNGFGIYPQNVQRLVEDVVDAADSVVDFSQYDNDSDGYVDALFVVHAGPGAEYTGSDNDIWSHKWSTYIPKVKDGVTISDYSMEPEYWAAPGDMTIGVFAHELGHVFGLPDLYDYDYNSQGAGEWSLMAGGSWNGPLGSLPAHPDAWSRYQLGFAEPTILTADTPGLSINAVETAPEMYYAWGCGAPNSEYFLLENRQAVGYDSALPGTGLLIWHVDESRWHNDDECRNHQNCNCAGNYLVALEQADGLLELESMYGYGDAGDPYPGSTNNRGFTLNSTPNSGSYDNCGSQVSVTNISSSAVTMTADVNVCSPITSLSWISLSYPGNRAWVFIPPTFQWTTDSGPGCIYAVDFAIPGRVPFFSTYGNLHIDITQKSWTVPQSLWDQIPYNSQVYWRVRGAVQSEPPYDVVTSDQVWTFYRK